MSPTRLLALCLLLCASATPARAQSAQAGTTALPILQLPLEGRAAVLGPGYAAVADDAFALERNPAGLSLLQRQEASFLYLKGVEDTAFEYLGYGLPLPFNGLMNSGDAALAASILFSQDGSIQVNNTNPDGSLASSNSLSAGSDFIATLGYSEKLGSEPISPGQEVEAYGGVSLMFIRSTLVQEYNATDGAANLGFLFRLNDPKVNLGLSVLNFGPPIRYLSASDPLPLTYEVGAAYTLGTIFDNTFTGTMGGDFYSVTHEDVGTAGLEWTTHSEFVLRVGYRFAGNSGPQPYSLGFGFTQDDFRIDYAWVPFDTLSDQQRVTLTYRFGAVRTQQVETTPIRDLDRSMAPSNPPPQAPAKKAPSGNDIIVPGWE